MMPQVRDESRLLHWAYSIGCAQCIFSTLAEGRNPDNDIPEDVFRDARRFFSSAMSGCNKSTFTTENAEDFAIFVKALFQCQRHPKKREEINVLLSTGHVITKRLIEKRSVENISQQSIWLLTEVFEILSKEAEALVEAAVHNQ